MQACSGNAIHELQKHDDALPVPKIDHLPNDAVEWSAIDSHRLSDSEWCEHLAHDAIDLARA